MRTLISQRRGCAVDPSLDFADRLLKWIQGGFPELGGEEGRCSQLTRRVATHEDFLLDPLAVAGNAAGPKAGDGALARVAACAFLPESAAWAVCVSRATHADARCTAACVVQTLLVRAMAEWRVGAPFPALAVRAAMAEGLGAVAIRPPWRAGDLDDEGNAVSDPGAEFLDWLRASKSLDSLDLGAPDPCGGRFYVYRTMACGLWAVRELWAAHAAGGGRDGALFLRLVGAIVAKGGSATAAATAGAIVGAAVGRANLPPDAIRALSNHNWLSKEIGFVLSVL